MDRKLENKTALITGGASGIGAAIALKFAAAGAKVFILDVNDEKGAEIVSDIGDSATYINTDVTDQTSFASAIVQVLRLSSTIDIIINNAGIAHVGKLENTSSEDFDKVYNVNVKGVYNGMHSVINQMKSQTEGIIINIASIASHIGIPDRFAYSMSKGAVLAMTYSVARDYIDSGIRCNSISPARVHTPFVDDFVSRNYPGKEKEMMGKLAASQPIGRMGKPEEVASLALFLCSNEARFITGTDFPIDGGFIKLNT